MKNEKKTQQFASCYVINVDMVYDATIQELDSLLKINLPCQ